MEWTNKTNILKLYQCNVLGESEYIHNIFLKLIQLQYKSYKSIIFPHSLPRLQHIWFNGSHQKQMFLVE